MIKNICFLFENICFKAVGIYKRKRKDIKMIKVDRIEDLDGLYDAIYHLSENEGEEWREKMLRRLEVLKNYGNSPIREATLDLLNDEISKALNREYGA